MKVSYLITCKNETDTLRELLNRVYQATLSVSGDEVVILNDNSDNEETKIILATYNNVPCVKIFEHALDNNYGAHKNFGNEQCFGEYIFQLDGDELPSEMTVGENLHVIIESNSGIELIFVPRINDYLGVTLQHAMQWGWRLSPSITKTHEKIIDTDSQEYKFLKENGYILEEAKVTL